MKGYDAFAGVIRSGGRTRRAAKMVILNADHPDIVEFIRCKADEERKAWALIDTGYDSSFNGEAYASIFFQNSNNSVRVTDDFMRAVGERSRVADPDDHHGRGLRVPPRPGAHGTDRRFRWLCGDPGMQFDTTVNDWNPCIRTARINASNPCSEYMFLDDSACNLASINLMKFRRADGSFDVESFCHTVDVVITAMEIVVDNSSYPTPAIERNSHAFRPLGLGFANLGAYLMSNGLPYDSDGARAVSGALTALMCGRAYRRSAELAEAMGPFAYFADNRDSFLRVMRKHAWAVDGIDTRHVEPELLQGARVAWEEAIALGEYTGYRNAQATVLAPTGTIAFMMDCDTTGIEPDIALVKYKKLVGGGMLKIVNNTVPLALRKLGYSEVAMQEIVDYIDSHDTIEGAPGLRPEHLPVFDCAFRPAQGERSIHYAGHVRMMAAAQPFLSGAISKTVNMPTEATPEEIATVYMQAWKMGLKAIAVYRDGCKRTQPLNTSLDEAGPPAAVSGKAVRRRLPDERQGPHPQVLHRRARGLHHRRHVRRQQARGDLHHHGEVGLRRQRAHGLLRHLGFFGAAIRRAAGSSGAQVRAHPLRAGRAHEQHSDPHGEVDHGLHLPLAGAEVSARDRRRGELGAQAGGGRAGGGEHSCCRRRAAAGAAAQWRCDAGPTGSDLARTAGVPAAVGCARMQRVRLDHGAQRLLLQVLELRDHERLQLSRRDPRNRLGSWQFPGGG